MCPVSVLWKPIVEYTRAYKMLSPVALTSFPWKPYTVIEDYSQAVCNCASTRSPCDCLLTHGEPLWTSQAAIYGECQLIFLYHVCVCLATQPITVQCLMYDICNALCFHSHCNIMVGEYKMYMRASLSISNEALSNLVDSH